MLRDLQDLPKRTIRSADERSKFTECYLKTDIEKRYICVLILDSLLIF